MNLWANIWIALQSLTTNKLRSALTMLGITIGVLSVILCTAVGNGVRQQILGQIQALGSNSIMVIPGKQKRGGSAFGIGTKPSLRLKDAEAIRRECPSSLLVASTLQSSAQVKYRGQNVATTIICTEPALLRIQNFHLQSGRFINAHDLQSRRKVCIIGKTTARALFGDSAPLGQMVRIKGTGFKIVGLMALKGSVMFGDPDDQVYIPVTTGMKVIFGVEYVTQLSIQTGSENQVAVAELDKTLRKRHRLAATEEADYTILSQAELLQSVNSVGRILTLLLAGIASIALLVGGIGIMNIMIVSVTERTHEIGIRKAVGAKKKDILFQFLIESMTVSVLGGTIGILLGLALSSLIASLLGWSSIVSPFWISVAFFSSTLIGIFFGIYPAYQAAQLDPIEALRYQ